MQNVTPFPQKPIIVKKPRKTESPKQPQPFSYIRMTLAVVIGNGIAVAGLFMMFLLYLNTITPFVD